MQNLDLTRQIFNLTQPKSPSNSEFRQVFASKCRKIVEKITLKMGNMEGFFLATFCKVYRRGKAVTIGRCLAEGILKILTYGPCEQYSVLFFRRFFGISKQIFAEILS